MFITYRAIGFLGKQVRSQVECSPDCAHADGCMLGGGVSQELNDTQKWFTYQIFSEFYEKLITAVFKMRALWNTTQICGILERLLSNMHGNIARRILFQPKPKLSVSLPVVNQGYLLLVRATHVSNEVARRSTT